MFPAPHYREQFSLMLSEVLYDIGVNEQKIARWRKLMQMEETLTNITMMQTGVNITSYYLGSKSEGTTTPGLESDLDYIACDNNVRVIQDLSEWEHGKKNYLMIQNENTTPGYCLLQLFQYGRPMPANEIPDEHHLSDRRRILCKNTIKDCFMTSGYEQHGPSIAKRWQHGFCDTDMVPAFPCKSWPQSASGWLKRQGTGGLPTHEMRRFTAQTTCFVVPTGSKVSIYPELEWRISTSLAEKYLMFNLNITQIRCYVLLKIILKSCLNPQGEINLSSFMIKTVLFHCIENTEPSIWVDNNLLTCLIFCLQELHSCVQNEHCSHFIISENNLMAGQFTSETNHKLTENVSDFIQNDRHFLLRIDTDYLGYRLQAKLNMVPQRVYRSCISFSSYLMFACNIFWAYTSFIRRLPNENFEEKMNQYCNNYLPSLMTYDIDNDEIIAHNRTRYQAPLAFTTYGSALASSSIGKNNEILPEAFTLLSDGLNSDVSSGKLKLASVFYSIGQMEKAEEILRQTKQKYLSHHVVPICISEERIPSTLSEDIVRVCKEHKEDCIRHIVAFCVHFIRQEINCVPHELQYEMFRSTQDDMKHRVKKQLWFEDSFMTWATVDSLLFLYFLQYKIYGHLKRHQEKQQALNKLMRTTFPGENLNHRETALNILGQIMEQENRPNYAFNCYIYSLRERARNNAAKIHLCRLLSYLLQPRVEKTLYQRCTDIRP
ncbi:uncharacterized protein LOC132740921 [Ruditapes philippinarum]|uniref:uncharacterized protein LOC132740921 n=1 Tax=Ruditapes philippinarum TaxID=129788 RepID=UPI00295B7068|nr:uncharacterized protein LOC132740921 [Ruditapes philippinarum]